MVAVSCCTEVSLGRENRMMNENKSLIIATKDGVVLRRATGSDLPSLDEIVVVCYTPIHDSYVQIVGEECAGR